MKTKCIFRLGLMALWLLLALSCRQTENVAEQKRDGPQTANATILPFSNDIKEDSPDVQEVWVCQSPGAKKYHLNRECGALKRCKHSVEKISVTDAEAVGLTKCSYKKCQ